ncbi:hypothetical protein [Amycolatopsis sacchari]|uniref:hypothetical protein n=1 Tax=Amycolatopsis sacchari TaxID=115433 RepID=UPI003D766213
MKRGTVARAVLAAVATGAAVMIVVSVTHDEASISAASTRVSAAPQPQSQPQPTETTTPALATDSAPAPPPALSAADARQLANRVQDSVRRTVPDAKVGLEVYDRTAGQAVTSLNADTTFSSMSVVKLLIAIDVLARNDWHVPGPAIQNRLTKMLSTSDDSIASAFWMSEGGTSIITRDVKLMGLTSTQPPSAAGQWGATKVTPEDLVAVYRYLEDNVPGTARDLIYDAMYHASRTAADGTDQFFGIPDGLPGTTWAIKQGWGSTGNTAYFHTTGLLGQDSRYVVIVLTSAPLAYYRSMAKALTDGTGRLAALLKP